MGRYYLTLPSYYLTLYLTVSITYLLITYTCMLYSTGRQTGARTSIRAGHTCRAYSLLVHSLARPNIHYIYTVHYIYREQCYISSYSSSSTPFPLSLSLLLRDTNSPAANTWEGEGARHVRIVLVILFSHLVHYPTLPYPGMYYIHRCTRRG